MERSRAGRQEHRRVGEGLLFALLLACHLAPVALLPRVPTQDGPGHQALAYAMAVLDEPEGEPLRRFLVRNEELVPNAFLFHAEAALLLWLPASRAETVMLAGYVVLLPLALRFALAGVSRDGTFLAALGFPFVYNFLTNLGFFNFGYALAGFLLGLGLLLRQRGARGWRRAGWLVLLALLALGVYVCHPVPLVALVVATGVLGGWWALRGAGRAGVPGVGRGLEDGGRARGVDVDAHGVAGGARDEVGHEAGHEAGGVGGGVGRRFPGDPAGGVFGSGSPRAARGGSLPAGAPAAAGLLGRFARALAGELLPPLVALLPAAALFVAFVGGRVERHTRWEAFGETVRQVVSLEVLASMDGRTAWVAWGVAALLAVLVARELVRRAGEAARRPGAPRRGEGLLLLAFAFVVMALLAPDDVAGGGFVVDRLTLLPPLALLLWLAGGRWGRGERWAAQLAAALLALAQLGLLWGRWQEVDRELDDFLVVARQVEAGETAVSVSFRHQLRGRDGESLPYRVFPWVHALGYAAAERPIVNLGLYQATTDLFPLRYRPEVDPYVHLAAQPGGLEWAPPQVDLPGYEERTGVRVDAVVIFQPGAVPGDEPAVRELYRQLATGWERAALSPRGTTELWRRRQPAGATR